jgi:hypothetical protein
MEHRAVGPDTAPGHGTAANEGLDATEPAVHADHLERAAGPDPAAARIPFRVGCPQPEA